MAMRHRGVLLTAQSSKAQDQRMTVTEKAYLARVADLGCALCTRIGYAGSPAEIHHVRTGIGKSERATHFLVVPLCPTHHRGAHGFHGDRLDFTLAGVTELDLLSDVIEKLFAVA